MNDADAYLRLPEVTNFSDVACRPYHGLLPASPDCGVPGSDWFGDGSGGMMTKWGGEYLDFDHTWIATGPTQHIGVNAINAQGGLPSWYVFHLDAYVDGVFVGTIFVPGSTSEVNSGEIETDALTSGRHKLRLVWTNDYYQASLGLDANIDVRNVYLRGVRPDRPPVARCRPLRLSADDACLGNGSIDDGSYDPEGAVASLTIAPAGPYPLGVTQVSLTIVDAIGQTASCSAAVTVVDDTPPVIDCNAPAFTPRPGLATSFTATAHDNCDPAPAVAVQDPICYRHTNSGDVIDAPEHCHVELSGPVLTESRHGVGQTIAWTAAAWDANGNVAQQSCATTIAPAR